MNTRVMLKRNPASNLAHTAQGLNRARAIEHALKSPAQLLDVATRVEMQTRLGHHFAHIPIFPAPHGSDMQIVDAQDRSELQAERASMASARDEKIVNPKTALPLDLNAVRIHTDARAAESARALNALAFTSGRDIFFDAGQYAPTTRAGQQLLAHELTHVAQQTCTQQTRAPQNNFVIQRQEKDSPAPFALQTALDGDDDDVRDLTHNAAWEDIAMDQKQSATLIIHLLDGITGGDDEDAGLEILRKDIGAGILDPTLWELNQRGRFGQLLDDFDGQQYRDLLTLLSFNIHMQKVRARYLDAFVVMSWVREHEERAIVDLLINTPVTDRAELLEPKFREESLREAIDTDALSVKYETLTQEALGERAKKVVKDTATWRKIFDEEAKKCIKQGMTKEGADDLFQRAVVDIEREVTHEIVELGVDVTAELVKPFGEPDPARMAELNRDFRKRMAGLLARKRREFCAELRWGVEFNRNLAQVSGTAWTKDDLDKMDKILSAIPDEILHADPDFRIFQREKQRVTEPRLAGEAGGDRITLLKGLTLSTTAHELGHIVHNVDPQLLNDFEDISGWELLDDKQLDALRRGDKDFAPLLARLDEKRKNDGMTRAECGEKFKDNFFYLYNRYGAGYFRHPSPLPEGKQFVSDYAGTHPRDDFAETFAEYLTNPNRLRGKWFREKFKFMHIEVFVRFWLRRQFRKVSNELDKIFANTLDKFPAQNAFVQRLRDGFVQDLWDKFFDTENALIRARAAEAEGEKFNTPIPLKGSTEARDKTAFLVTGARDMMALAAKILPPHVQLGSVLMGAFLELDASLEGAFTSLTTRLMNDFEFDLWAQFEPLAERILKGEHIVKDKWTEVDALAAQMDRVPDVIESYLNIYAELIQARLQLFNFVRDELLKLKDGSEQKKSFHAFSIARLKRFNEAMQRVQDNVRAGTPFEASAFGNPKMEAAQDIKDITAFKRTLKP